MGRVLQCMRSCALNAAHLSNCLQDLSGALLLREKEREKQRQSALKHGHGGITGGP